jgi:YidC/Oxa1 family membrane protein insertase
MEKRTLIAFVLSFLILILWSFLFTPKEPQVPPASKELTEEKRPTKKDLKGRVEVEPVKPPEIIPQKDVSMPEAEEREIIVDTPLYRAVFSNKGAVLRSFQLKKYHLTTDPQSPMIELVTLQDQREDFFKFSFEVSNSGQNTVALYRADQDRLVLNDDSPPKELTFKKATDKGMLLTQIYRFYPDTYHFDLTVTLANHSEGELRGQFGTQLKNRPPEEKKSYYSFIGIAFLMDGNLEEIKRDDMEETQRFSGLIQWVAYEEDFFISAVIPEDGVEGSLAMKALPTGSVGASYLSTEISLETNEKVSSRYTLYLGPRDLGILKTMGKNLDLAINFGWTDIIAKPLLYALRFFNNYVNNYGVSIIILTILIKILFWPLTHKSYKSMKEMQKLQPLMTKIREKHKNNKEQMNKELMGLYKTYKVNPMGGCLPMIIQIPVFFALFRILGNSIELRHAPFFLWINDLSAPDRLFNFPFQIPFMSPPYGIPVLTLLMGASMLIQQKMTPTPGDPTQAKIMMFLPIIFTVMFINFPSGLVLYWLVNNILSIGQQYRIKKSAD